MSLLLVLLSLVACTPQTSHTGALTTTLYDAEVRLGTGEIAWQDVDEGGAVYVVYGPQGGYHLLGSVRTRGLNAGNATDLSSVQNPTTAFSVIWNEAEMVMSSPIVQGMDTVTDENAAWTHEMIGRFAILDITTDQKIAGEEVTFSVTVTDSIGQSYSDTRDVIVEPHPSNTPG
jgi:hypothetical protein